ncbi:MAG: helix-turn-helix domain-containing protein [Candidatus Latescibacteria bacterium]|nr:helix-turn-helix domain-containing protein [Candidatus Latescibacterota bacterium]
MGRQYLPQSPISPHDGPMTPRAAAHPPGDLDPLIHEAARLAIVAALAQCRWATFGFLLQTTQLSRGNMSTHIARLVQAGYIEEEKEIIGRRPRTEYTLSQRGRTAYQAYCQAWQQLTGGGPD